MELTIQKPVLAIALQRGETLSLHDARGLRIVGQSGVVWITEERGEADHIVQPGVDFTVTRAGRTVLEALKTGVVEIDESRAHPAPHVAPARGRGTLDDVPGTNVLRTSNWRFGTGARGRRYLATPAEKLS